MSTFFMFLSKLCVSFDLSCWLLGIVRHLDLGWSDGNYFFKLNYFFRPNVVIRDFLTSFGDYGDYKIPVVILFNIIDELRLF